MIVELIGCAGAGKTTLRRIVGEQGIEGRRVVAMPDLVLDRAVLRSITHPTAVNVVQELRGLPYLLGALGSEREFLAFARTMLRRASSRYDRLNGMRGVARKVGMYHLASRRAPEAVVLSDEGTLLSAYNLFVMTRVDFDPDDVERFARLVPLPDAVVYVRAPVASLVARAHVRPDPRRQHLGRDRAAVERDVRRTVELFDLLAATPSLSGRVLAVDNEDADAAGRRRLAERLAVLLQPALATAAALQTSHGGAVRTTPLSGARP